MGGAAAAPAISVSTRERLIEAAISVFSERGYDGAGVQEIARRAGLTTGAIYANFRGKAELLFAAIGSRSARELDDLLVAHHAPTAGELLAELGSHLLERDPNAKGGLLVEAMVAARRDPDVAELVASVVDERRAAIGRLIEQARAEGAIASGVSTDAMSTFSLVLALGSLLYTSLGIEGPSSDDWSALIRRFVGALKEEDTNP